MPKLQTNKDPDDCTLAIGGYICQAFESQAFPAPKHRLEITVRPDAGCIPGLLQLLNSGATEEISGLVPQKIRGRVIDVALATHGNYTFTVEIDEHV